MKGVKDLHLFTTLLVFPRLPHITMALDERVKAGVHVHMHDFMLTGVNKEHLLNSYAVIVGRILVKQSPNYQWLSRYLPQHIHHEYDPYMAMKTVVSSAPMLFKNEAKYEDCLDICDAYENHLITLYQTAFVKDTSLELCEKCLNINTTDFNFL